MSREVHNMFRSIARRYDLANDVLSLGIHRVWRKSAIRFSGVSQSAKVLDLCTGTGDVMNCLDRAVGPSGMVVGLDFVYEMLEFAVNKKSLCQHQNLADNSQMRLVQGDATKLPFATGTFDLVTIAFGIRNVDGTGECLREMLRVLKQGSRAMILEFGKPTTPGFAALYRFYGTYLMPVIGGLLTGDRGAYEYLPRTASEFPNGQQFLAMMEQAGFSSLSSKCFLSGVAYAYLGMK